jgi:2-oxoisovalerate dehydrogenase E1 component
MTEATNPISTARMCCLCLRQMIRIRKFEDKCAELYTQEKIRGFLHLYDGEEAIAAGLIPVLRPMTASSPPIANMAMR